MCPKQVMSMSAAWTLAEGVTFVNIKELLESGQNGNSLCTSTTSIYLKHVYLQIYLQTYLSIHPSTHPPIQQSTHWPIHILILSHTHIHHIYTYIYIYTSLSVLVCAYANICIYIYVSIIVYLYYIPRMSILASASISLIFWLRRSSEASWEDSQPGTWTESDCRDQSMADWTRESRVV